MPSASPRRPSLGTVLLFHHAQGQTPRFLSFADDLRPAEHAVHAPDLYDGRRFRDLFLFCPRGLEEEQLTQDQDEQGGIDTHLNA